MQPEPIFSFASTFVLVGWLLLIFAFRWKHTLTIVRLGVILLLSILYTFLIITHFGDGDGGFGSLEEVSLLFENPWALLAGWVHYLAFDLFVGSWEVQNARSVGISHWFVIPCLLLTFLFGPLGLLLYLIIRTAYTKQMTHEFA